MDKPYALIVEDDRDISALFRHVLDMDGFRTEIALHGQTAIDILSNSRPDLILLDLNLPGVPGEQILKGIRKDKRLIHSKVIVTTAHAEIAEGLQSESDLILLKPVSVEQFSELVKRFYLMIRNDKTIPVQDKPWDLVTGLYNQYFFINRLTSALKRSEEVVQYSFAVVSITLDQNENARQHLDIKLWISALRETADMLRSIVRPTDTLARFDEGDFYILIEDIPNKDIPRQIAARIHTGLNEHLAGYESEVRFPIRIGIILCGHDYKNVEQVLHDAYAANSLAQGEGEFFYNDPEKK